MASVNKVILVGNCGRDPEVRYLPSGQAVANVSIATSSKRKDKQTGDVIEDTQWHRITFYDRLAEIAGEYVKKGRPIYVEGRIKYGVYTDKTTGVEKPTCDIIATELQLLGAREDGQQGGTQQGNAQRSQGTQQRQAPQGQQRQAQGQQRQAPQNNGGGGGHGGGFGDMDDDIPFISCDAGFDMESRLERRIRRGRI
jgi:single-strand DNA-binding protein